VPGVQLVYPNGAPWKNCFRFVDDGEGKPDRCPEPVISSGWLQVGPSCHLADACGQHSAQLRF
jgi:hypothetical protein